MPDEVSNRSRRSGAPPERLRPERLAPALAGPASGASPGRPVGSGHRRTDQRGRRARRSRRRPTATRSTIPARGARSSFCIFIASTTRSRWPASTASPASTATDTTRPGMMARTSVGPSCAGRRRGRAVARSRRAARSASSTSSSNRQPSTTTSTRGPAASPRRACGRQDDRALARLGIGRGVAPAAARSASSPAVGAPAGSTSATTWPVARSVTRSRVIAATGRSHRPWRPRRPGRVRGGAGSAAPVRSGSAGLRAAADRPRPRPRPPPAASARPLAPRPSQCSRDPVDRQRRPPGSPSCLATNRWNGRVVWMPAISVSSSARRRRSMAASRSPAWTMTLAIEVVVVGRDPVAGPETGVDPDARAGRHDPAADPARRRARSHGPGPRPRGGPRWRGSAGSAARVGSGQRAAAESGSPAASRNCSWTMSMPATSSVTPCSTWSRVLTSRK